MQDDDRGHHFKTIADSVQIIGTLGQQLAALQADVVTIEGLPVDSNGNAEAIINVTSSPSLHMLRIPPQAMLMAKGGEIARLITALRTEFSEFLDQGEVLLERCKPHRPAALAPPPRAFHAPDRMLPNPQQKTDVPPSEPGHVPDRNGQPVSPLRPRIFPMRGLRPSSRQ